MSFEVEKLLLAAPRGYCAGVDRAVQTVERALELYGAPVYVRKEIVHNKHVVEQLRARGAIFVDEIDESIPEGATTVFSAHGVSPAVHAQAAEPRCRRSTPRARSSRRSTSRPRSSPPRATRSC
jgi:4-hydroxy-3-methylbut-2-enyl diphosphate reductase